MTLMLRRNHNYYEVTLFTPVILLAFISCLGNLLPMRNEEKMEFSIQILLALVIYIEYIRGTVPVWPTADEAAIIVWLFIASCTVVTLSSFEAVWSIMVYLTKDDQVMNFGRLRATYTHIMTKFLNMICLNIALSHSGISYSIIIFGKKYKSRE